ncbi:MAG: zinc-binding alcohol dehydrogenase family protein [Actinobacteria bacterium]|nr:zinc-binding alcohol dehydrogenase family protein [Actinomycetota bacterium]
MKAAVYSETGGPEVFRYLEVPDPEVGPGAVLVRNEFISIEGGDVLSRAGGDLGRTPHIVGYQSAGTVEAVGDAVTSFVPGDRVVTLAMDGSHAELRAVPEGFAWKIPEGLSTDDAATVPVPFGTAHDALFEFGRLTEGETVLVTAGSGGVGVAAIQLAKRAGARVLTTASTSEKLARLIELGADDGIAYRDENIAVGVRRLTGGRGVDLVVENVGGATFTDALSSLAYRGRCVSVGEVGRGDATVAQLSMMRERNLTVVGYFMGMEMLVARRCHAMVAGVLDAMAAGELRAVIDRRFALAEAAEAHAWIESGVTVGRVLLVP